MAKITFLGAGHGVRKNVLGDVMMTEALPGAHIALSTSIRCGCESRLMLEAIDRNGGPRP